MGLDSSGNDHEIRLVDGIDRIIISSNEHLPFFLARMVQPDPEDSEATVVCEAGGNPMSFPIHPRFTFPHALEGGPTTTLLGLDADDGTFIDPNEVDTTWDNNSAYRLTVVVSDAAFDDSDPMNDTVTLDVTTVEVWRCDAWRNVQQPMQVFCGVAEPTLTPVDDDCFWQNGPFTFTRTASLGETCE